MPPWSPSHRPLPLTLAAVRLCPQAPRRQLLESLVRDALASDAPAQRRVAQALVLALCRQEGCAAPPPPSGSEAAPADAESVADAEAQLRAWPRAPPRRRALADGGWETYGDDLSEGAERLPVPWCNATADGEVRARPARRVAPLSHTHPPTHPSPCARPHARGSVLRPAGSANTVIMCPCAAAAAAGAAAVSVRAPLREL